MSKTNWQDPGSSEILSSHISGLQEAIGKIEDILDVQLEAETNVPLTEVYISETDRYRIYQAPEGKRNWAASPAPVIKKNGAVIDSGFTIDYGGGAIILSPAATSTDVFTADFSRVKTDGNKLTTHLADYVSVKRFGAVGDGVTNDAPAIQNAIDSFAAGGLLLFPSGTYKLDTDIDFKGKPINMLMYPDAKFTGTGKMPPCLTNTLHRIINNYLVTYPTGGVSEEGYNTFAAEVMPDSTFNGNAVAAFFGAESPESGSGGIWGSNVNWVLHAGFEGNGVGLEIDASNFAADGKGEALLINGIGDKKLNAGLRITRLSGAADYGQGILVQHAEHGIRVDLTGSNNPLTGLYIKGLPRNHIVLMPSDDLNPTTALIYGTNSAGSIVVFNITKEGTGIFAGGVTLGGGTQIKKHISVSSTLNFGSIPAQSSAELTVTVTGAAVGDSVVATPSIALVAGCSFCAYVSAANTVTIRIVNATASAVDPDGAGGATWRVDVWKH